MKKLIILLFVFVFIACSEEKTYPEGLPFVEISNENLRREISDYQKRMLENHKKDIAKGDSVYVLVAFKVLQDSITRFSIGEIETAWYIDFDSPLFWTYIDNKTVFFVNGLSSKGIEPIFTQFLRNPSKVKKYIEERYFPNEIPLEKLDGKVIDIKLSHPMVRHLTFLKDSLIDKQEDQSAPMYKRKVMLNGKEVWL